MVLVIRRILTGLERVETGGRFGSCYGGCDCLGVDGEEIQFSKLGSPSINILPRCGVIRRVKSRGNSGISFTG